MPIANDIPAIARPFCFVVYARAPQGVPIREANRLFNEYSADPSRGIVLFHDHFMGSPGGVAVFFVENAEQRGALADPGVLNGWHVEAWPLNHSHSPGAFDEQVAYTVRNYAKADWNELKQVDRPTYG